MLIDHETNCPPPFEWDEFHNFYLTGANKKITHLSCPAAPLGTRGPHEALVSIIEIEREGNVNWLAWFWGKRENGRQVTISQTRSQNSNKCCFKLNYARRRGGIERWSHKLGHNRLLWRKIGQQNKRVLTVFGSSLRWDRGNCHTDQKQMAGRERWLLWQATRSAIVFAYQMSSPF